MLCPSLRQAAPPSHHKAWLRKRLAWRLQADIEGTLSRRARARAAALVQNIVWRLAPPNDAALQEPTPSDSRSETAPRAMAAAAPTPERARADGASVDHTPDRAKPANKDPARRQPLPGTRLTRTYKGQTLAVEVLAKGFRWQGRFFKSLSAVAKTITGQHCSGFYFFRNAKESS